MWDWVAADHWGTNGSPNRMVLQEDLAFYCLQVKSVGHEQVQKKDASRLRAGVRRGGLYNRGSGTGSRAAAFELVEPSGTDVCARNIHRRMVIRKASGREKHRQGRNIVYSFPGN